MALFVKNVLSADTLVLRNKPQNGPPPEQVFSLSAISTPTLGNSNSPQNPNNPINNQNISPNITQEQPFAFLAREFLRKLVIGQQITYSIHYTTTSNHRNYGSIAISTPYNNETILNRIMVKEGWAKVKSAQNNSQNSQSLDQNFQFSLLDLQTQAQEKKLGIWNDVNPSIGVRKASYSLDVEEIQPFLSKYKNTPINAIIEQVRDASTVRLCLLLQENNHQYITLNIAGIKSPILKKGIPNVPDLIEPFAEEAKYFVESRLLQRDVKITLNGASPLNNSLNSNSKLFYPSFIGSIDFSLGDIAVGLLSEGLVKVNDWTLSLVPNPEKYRSAELRAKEKRIRMWKEYVQPKQLSILESEFEAIVVRILGSDMILVEELKSHKERKLQLSSIKGVKRQKNAAGLEIGYFPEAFEFLRSRLIGKTVRVKIDYVKPAEGEFESRDCATIMNDTQNVAEALVSKGLANVIRHKQGDPNRSSKYDSLLISEDRAQKSNKGIWSDKELVTHRITDASESLSKAKQFLPYFQKTGDLHGILEYASSGSRFRIYIPSQSCRITFVLGGVRVPRAAGASGNIKGEPFGAEALDFTNRNFLQRDVTLQVQNIDKAGGFIGSVFIEREGLPKENVALALLKKGLATVHDFSAAQTSFANALYESETAAKTARLGLWKDYDPQAEAEAEENAKKELESNEGMVSEPKDAIVSEITSNGTLYLQFLGDDIKRLEKMMQSFSLAYKEPGNTTFSPKVGEMCAAQFSQDGQWYRAQVLGISKEKYTVLYADYGNSEELPSTKLRSLKTEFSAKVLPAQAVACKLGYIQLADIEDDFGVEALEVLKTLLEGKTLKAKKLNNGKPLQVVLYDKKLCVNQELLHRGLAYIDKAVLKRHQSEHKAKVKAGAYILGSASINDELEKMIESQDEAKRNHLKIWRYGDFTQDED